MCHPRIDTTLEVGHGVTVLRRELRGLGATNPASANQNNVFVFRHFRVTGLEFRQWNQRGLGDMHRIPFVLLADIYKD